MSFRYQKNSKFVMLLILILSSFLRLSLSLINTYSDDDHLADIKFMIREGYPPDKQHCVGSCYTPKLYYIFNALILTLFPIHESHYLTVTNLINGIMGCVMLYYIFLFLESAAVKNETKIVAYALISFNPGLMRINIQTTPNTFSIAFGVITTYYAYDFFEKHSTKDFILMTIFTCLTVLSKLNGLVIFIMIALILSLEIIRAKKVLRSALIRSLLVYLSVVLVIFFIYLIAYEPNKNILAYTKPSDLPLYMIKETYPSSPGIVSIYKGYFTFPFYSLVNNPKIVNLVNTNSTIENHMGSLWTQLYGRSIFLPYSCGAFNGGPQYLDYLNIKLDRFYLFIGRSAIILGLILIFIFIYGVAKGLRETRVSHVFLLYLILAFLAFIIIFTSRYRNFYNMKDIYIYPAFLSIVFIFSLGLDNVHEAIKPAIMTICALIVCLHILDFFQLIRLLI